LGGGGRKPFSTGRLEFQERVKLERGFSPSPLCSFTWLFFFTAIILVTQEAEMEGSQFKASLGKKIS
jgi:hypothetical protein